MIALFDSGLGGLSVLREVRALLPSHDMLYLADSACCPYGPKPIEFVCTRSLMIGRWLEQRGAEMLVVACNTASSAALELLRAELTIPIVGMEPGLKPAVAATKTGRIGVLATSGTLTGARFASLVQRYAYNVEVIVQPCPRLVEQVEIGEIDGMMTRSLLRQYIDPLLAREVDTLVLGCTHYPFLREPISEIAGSHVAIIDTGPAVARQVTRVATQSRLRAGSGQLRCWTTGEVTQVAPVLWRLLDTTVTVEFADIV